MKKASIEMILLLSNVYDRKRISAFLKEARNLSGDALELLFDRVEDQKSRTLSVIADQIEAALEKNKITSGTAEEIVYLLLTRYKLKVPVAAQRFTEALAREGVKSSFSGGTNRAKFISWLKELSGELPRETLLDAAMELRPASLS
jgi:hypothetical protein